MSEALNNLGSLQRVAEGRLLGGVCSGIARHFSTSVWVVRAITLAAVIFAPGLTEFAYLVAYLALRLDTTDATGLDELSGLIKGEKRLGGKSPQDTHRAD